MKANKLAIHQGAVLRVRVDGRQVTAADIEDGRILLDRTYKRDAEATKFFSRVKGAKGK